MTAGDIEAGIAISSSDPDNTRGLLAQTELMGLPVYQLAFRADDDQLSSIQVQAAYADKHMTDQELAQVLVAMAQGLKFHLVKMNPSVSQPRCIDMAPDRRGMATDITLSFSGIEATGCMTLLSIGNWLLVFHAFEGPENKGTVSRMLRSVYFWHD